MAINQHIAHCVCKCFWSLRWDTLYAHEFFDAMSDDLEFTVRWQWSVDLIFRLLKSNLIYMGHHEKKGYLNINNRENKIKEENNYVEELSFANPKSCDLNDYAIWSNVDLALSSHGERLFSVFFADQTADEYSSQFVEEIERQFESSGVPWKEDPLVKICCSKGGGRCG
jgi:hypothetical protein